MSAVWQVALRELRERGRSKTFLITSALILLLVVGLVVVPQFLNRETETYAVGLIGDGNEPIVVAADQLANANDEPDEPASVEIETTKYDEPSPAEIDLEKGIIDAILIGAEEVVVERATGIGGSTLLDLLQRGAAAVELEAIIAEEGEAATEVIGVMTSDPLETTTLTGADAGDESGVVVAYAGLLLLYMAILLYGTWILTGVTEEKSNRVVEVLLSSLRPWQLLAGKILGIGTLGVTQFAGTVIVAVIALQVSGTFDIPSISGATIFNLIFWFVVGFFTFAVLFGAAGSLVSRQEDAQTVAVPMTVSAVAGFFLAVRTLDDPDGVAAVIGTFIPITAPFVVPVRAALDAIPAWQYGAAALVAIAAAIGLVFIGGRIYAGGVLRYGGKVGFREAWRSARE